MPASGRTDGRGLLQGESEEAALQLERQRNKDRVLIGASIAVYTSLVIVVCAKIESIFPLIVEMVAACCCWSVVKWRKRGKSSERASAQDLLDSTPAARRGFVYSDVPGMEDKLVDLAEVVQGTNLTDMVLMHATEGTASATVFQGQVVKASASRSEAGVFYCDSACTGPRVNLAGAASEHVPTGTVVLAGIHGSSSRRRRVVDEDDDI